MEHFFLKGGGICLLDGVVLGAVEHALAAGAGGADVPAGVTADALAQLRLEESEFLLRRHSFDLFHLGKPICVHGIGRLQELFVKDHMVLALTHMATLQHGILVSYGLIAVQGADLQHVACNGHVQNTFHAQLPGIQLAPATDADDVSLFPVYPVLLHELLEAVAVTGLQKYQGFPLFFRGLDHIFA